MRVFTIPNVLTMARLLSLPIVMVLFRSGRCYFALGVFLAGMATDVLDGWIAVRFNQRSTLGLYLDPVVDKIVLLAMFYELARASLLPWAVPHLFLARELLQNGVRTVAATRGETVGANWMGKAKAFLQTILISWGLAMPALEKSSDESFYSCLSFSFTLSCILVLALAWVFFGVFVYWNRRRISTDMNA